MENEITLLGIDFGNEYIRLSKTRFNLSRPEQFHPQIIEFNGRRSLRNILLFDSTLGNVVEIGDDVYDGEMAAETPDRLFRSMTLGAAEETIFGKGTSHLLKFIYESLSLSSFSSDEMQYWHTLLALPIGEKDGTGRQWIKRLEQSQFPNPCFIPSAAVSIQGYFQQQPDLGSYLVIDCGASTTRFSMVEVRPNQEMNILEELVIYPGGRDFDRELNEHFSRILTNSTVSSSENQIELEYHLEEFKKQFAYEVSGGADTYQALFRVMQNQAVFKLNRSEFESPELAGELIADFRNQAFQFVRKNHLTPDNLNQVLIVGGGAHWYFVEEWAHQFFGDGKYYLGDYPEEEIIKGLPYCYALNINVTRSTQKDEFLANNGGYQSVVDGVDQAMKETADLTEPIPKVKKVKVEDEKLIAPWGVFALEFGFGLLGFLGVGWFWGLREGKGCALLIGWWLVVAILLVLLLASTAVPLFLLIVIPIWLFGSFFSAFFAYRVAQNKHQKN